MKLIVLIPALNEEATIEKVVCRIPQNFEGVDQVTVLVVDDGSNDRTAKNAKKAGAIVVTHAFNKGVGGAFSTGLDTALELGADLMVNIDADGQFSPDDIPALIQPILNEEADFVTGDRFTDPQGNLRKPENMPVVKFWGNQRMSQLISFLTKKQFGDVSCGFRAYSKEAMLQINLMGQFTYTQETFLDLANKGLKISAVPVGVTYFPERESRVAGSIFKYMLRTLKIILRAYRDYSPFRFFGWLGLLPYVVGSAFLGFVLIHYIRVSAFTPYKSVAFAGIYLVSLAILFWIVGLLADMFVRVRLNQEQILYYAKKQRYYKGE